MAKQLPKIGIAFNDQGGRLSAALDIEKLVAAASKNKVVVRADIFNSPLADDFEAWIDSSLSEQGMDRVLFYGGFTEQQKTLLTSILEKAGINPYMVEWFDPLDQGLLNTKDDQAVRDKKALAILKTVLARVKNLEPLEPEELPANERTLIVGGGVTGLHTAASLVKQGKPVTLVEKNSGLGGKVAQLARFYPRMCDPHCGLEHVLFPVLEHELFDMRTLAKVEKLDGSPGRFEATVCHAPRYVNEQCDGCGKCETVCPASLNDLEPLPECRLPAEVLEKDKAEGAEESQAQDEHAASEEADASGEETFSYDAPIVRREPMFTRKAIHPSMPMAHPVSYVIEREHCPPQCRECEKICPNNAVELDQKERTETVEAGAVLLATGWDRYRTDRLEGYAYGLFPGVIDNLDMEQLLSPDNPHVERLQGISPAELKSVGFIQCVGSRDECNLPYCSSVCCTVTMKQILELKRINPDVQCYVFYMDVRTSGFDESMYRQARESGTVFINERPSLVRYDESNKKLLVDAHDQILDRKLRAELDLLVLAGGMRPSDGTIEAGKILRMPTDKFGFFESHKQCYPADSQRSGIFVGGCAREPMNVSQSIESGAKAALEALVFLGKSIRIEPTYPVVNDKKCDQCGRCVEECPFEVLSYNEKDIPVPDLAKCRQCGNCMGICPKVAVNLGHRNIKQYSSQIEVLGENTAFLTKKEPVVLAFLCENDAWLAAREAQAQGLVPQNVVAMQVPCAGSVNNALIADALSIGIDGVFVGACPDDTCHYVKGNKLIQKRFDDLAEKLKSMSMDTERVTIAGIGPRDAGLYVSSISECIEKLREKGPNPFKM